jgi:signal transduction histidine kinase
VALKLMVLSVEDVTVVIFAVAIGMLASAAVAGMLGMRVRANSRQLHGMTRAIVAGKVPGDAPPAISREFCDFGTALHVAGVELDRARLRESQLERARTQAVSWISHDLKTPLAGIRAMAEALEDRVAANPDEYLRQICDQVDDVAGLVDDLVEYSAMAAGNMRFEFDSVDVAIVLEDVIATVTPIAARAGVSLRVVNPTTGRIAADRRLLARAFRNLLDNAIRYSPSGSSILVTSGYNPAGRCTASVEDACGGIRLTLIPKVFDPGWRADSSRGGSVGSGLRLAIARSIARAHGGDIEVVDVNHGCHIELTLPPYGAARSA